MALSSLTGLVSPSSVDADRTPMPTEGMKAISAIISHASAMTVAAMRVQPLGLGSLVGGNNWGRPPVVQQISGINRAALAGLAAMGGLVATAAAAGKSSSAPSTGGKSSKKSQEKAETPSNPSPKETKPAGPTPPPGGTATIPEPPVSAPKTADPKKYSGFEEPELGKGTTVVLGKNYDVPYEIPPIISTSKNP